MICYDKSFVYNISWANPEFVTSNVEVLPVCANTKTKLAEKLLAIT